MLIITIHYKKNEPHFFKRIVFSFIVFYVVIGTLSHAKTYWNNFYRMIKPKLFLRGEIPPSIPLLPNGETPLIPPLTLIKNEGEELIRKGKEYFLN